MSSGDWRSSCSSSSAKLRSDRFEQRSLIFPIGLGIYGAVILNGTSKHHPVTAASAALLCSAPRRPSGSASSGGARSSERDGELWERATWATIAGWIGLLVTRILIIAAATVAGATLAASPSSIPLHAGDHACGPDDRGRPACPGNWSGDPGSFETPAGAPSWSMSCSANAWCRCFADQLIDQLGAPACVSNEPGSPDRFPWRAGRPRSSGPQALSRA